jgi:PhzF family phenazine biosynthesis protein
VDSIEIYQIDAFTDKVFHGNPAAICLLKEWLNDELLQAIASENNLSETAFVMEDNGQYQIRWFATNEEVSLCGHATLAAGFLLFEFDKSHSDTITFSSAGGLLKVKKKGERLTLDFPRLNYIELPGTDIFTGIIDKPIIEAYVSDLDYIVVLANEKHVAKVNVDLRALEKLPMRGLIVTSTATEVDFYSRCFYPRHNISEDPVTGSAYCVLTPFWTERLNKKRLHAIQGSQRQGEVFCECKDDRVYISGYCRWYSKGHLMI